MGLSHSPTIVSDGLIFYIDPNNTRSYPGFGNTVYNLINSSIGGTLVNFTANPIDNAGNRSINFNGSNNVVLIPSSNLQFGSSNFTIQFWFKIQGIIDGRVIFCDSWDVSNGGFLFYTSISSGSERILFYSTNTNGTWDIASAKDLIVSPLYNTWYNAAVTRIGNNFTLYINGQVTNTFSSSLSLRNTGYPIYSLGASPTAGNASKCSIGSVFIYRDKGLSAAEINQNYHATKKQYLVEENIVSDGLILNLDPGNPRSYAGAGNTIYDLAGFGNTGTLTNGPTFSALNGGSISYDGTNDSIVFSRNNILSGTQNFTIEAFIYPIATSPEHIFGNYNNGNNTGFELYIYAQKITVYYGGTYTFSNPVISANAWYHICATRSGNTVSIYINGSLDTTGTNSSSIGTNLPYTIGNGYDYNTEAFLGNISQVKVYNRTLTPIEIQQNYNATKNRFVNVLPIVRNDFILNLDAANTASYPGSGTSWFDLSGSNNTSVLTNGPTFSATGDSSSIIFDGSNDYVVVNSNANLLSKTEYTKFVFFYATSFSTANNLISGGVSGTNHAFWLYSSNRLYAGHNGDWLTFAGNTTLSLNTWYCGAVTFSNVSGWKLYLNGVLDGTSASTTTFNNNGELRVAAYSDGNFFTGRIPLALVYNRALSAYEIKQNFDFYRTRYGI